MLINRYLNIVSQWIVQLFEFAFAFDIKAFIGIHCLPLTFEESLLNYRIYRHLVLFKINLNCLKIVVVYEI